MVNPSELMTIKAFAAASGRSQQTIYKQIGTRLAPYVHEISGQKYIEGRAMAEVFKIGENQPKQPEINSTQTSPLNSRDAEIWDEVKFLREQILAKDRQIDAKDKQLEEKDRQIKAQQEQLLEVTAALKTAQNSLQGAQALHAGTMKQLESGEQPDRECQDETAIDAEVEDLPPDEPQAAPEPKPGFAERFRRALKVLKGE